jgi:inosine-uridine nucleoside N-ribohydrolase
MQAVLLILFWVITLAGCSGPARVEPALLILDTDLSSDVDDVGAVAVLHSLAQQGKVKILAMMVSSGDPWSVPCLAAINAWFGQPAIPIGQAQDGLVGEPSSYTRAVAEASSRRSPRPSNATTDAVLLYRQVLAAQPDQAVTIVTVGYLTNLHHLLQSKPDAVSPLDGLTLVRQKVKRLVCMGGQYPSGREWNFSQDAKAALAVVNHWPTPIVFVGFEIGKEIVTGAKLRSLLPSNPIRHSYELHNKLAGRPSWDQLAVYYAVTTADKETSSLWATVYGRNVVSEDGSNHWLNTRTTDHAYLVQRSDSATIAAMIEHLMLPSVP